MRPYKELCTAQRRVHDEIVRIQELARKEGSRRTINSVQQHIQGVENLWNMFQATDDDIRNHDDLDMSNEYITKDVFNLTKDLCEKTMEKLNQYLKALQTTTTAADAQTSGASQVLQAQSIPSHPIDTDQQIRKKRMEIKLRNLRRILDNLDDMLTQQRSTSFYASKRNTLEQMWSDIQNLHEEIEIFSSTTQQDDQFFTVEDEVLDAVAKLSDKESEINRTDETVRLPNVRIPFFGGDYLEWSSFHDLFVRVIDSNAKLSAVEKMQYLKTHLKDEAAKLLQHLSVSDANYRSAWETLKNRYDNKRLITMTHLDKILNATKLQGESAAGLKELHDRIKESLLAIANLGIDTTNWDPIIVHIIVQKMDSETAKYFEQSLVSPREIPTLQKILNFLETRFQALETTGGLNKKPKPKVNNYHLKTNKIQCPMCEDDHALKECKSFLSKSPFDRFQLVKKLKLCMNCLRHKSDATCYEHRTCKKCNKKHHTLLHNDKFAAKNSSKTDNNGEEKPARSTTVSCNSTESNGVVSAYNATATKTVLLATVLVKVRNLLGGYDYVRALLDPGSQATFITQEVADTLALPQHRTKMEVCGVGKRPTIARKKIFLEITPRFPSTFLLRAEAMVLKELTKSLPSAPIAPINLDNWKNAHVADPMFHTPGPIQMILGADIYAQILQHGQRRVNKGLVAQNTLLGWVILGEAALKEDNRNIVSLVSITDLDDTLKRFWEVEELSTKPAMSEESKQCELHYATHTERNFDGSYTVKIPFKQQNNELGESRPKAVARLLQLEKRLANNSALRTQYDAFMQEYYTLGHMKLTTEPKNENTYYIPHQAVFKEDSTTTKLRVVFDASSKTDNSRSLNELMHTGPRLQENLYNILIRWRKYRIVFTADIEKMYRQIKIHLDHQDFQRILWRFTTEEPIQEFKLTTVTYGTASAPYLAVRTLRQLAGDEAGNYPAAAEVTREDFYMDDVLSGGHSLDEVKLLQEQLIKLMKAGNFNLRKWASNSSELLEDTPDEAKEGGPIELSQDTMVKTLGLYWIPATDTFHFKVNLQTEKCTKRTILSDIARLYDPLGWLAPVMIKGKLIMQQLWLDLKSWDEALTTEVEQTWNNFRNQLLEVKALSIPRWIGYDGNQPIELHGFCDASEKAYGAVIYVRTLVENNIRCTLLTAKSKVAPVKMKKTIPRLELCSAVLLARLIKVVTSSLKINNISLHAWTDSTIALAWIQGNPERWKNFVANRVSEIQDIIKPEQWRHVTTDRNPADAVSRGVEPAKLIASWWNGPSWLEALEVDWHQPPTVYTTSEEQRKHIVCANASTETTAIEIFLRFSTLSKLTRTIAYCLRIKTKGGSQFLNGNEIRHATDVIIRCVQREVFQSEISALEDGDQIEKKSSLVSLTPFIDGSGLLRVGGRLKNSMLTYNEKHPLIIPHNHHLTRLIIENAHMSTLHGSNSLTAAFIRQKYWIIRGRNVIRQTLNRCHRCVRLKASTMHQLMGDLPSARVSPSGTFEHTGIDFAGPVQVRVSKGRGNKSYKGYIAVLVCLSTKAIHIELVSDLTTNSFLAAFTRFVSRRGPCHHVYSDNGTTFVGAQRILAAEIKRQIDDSLESLQDKGIQWHFIPPGAPHFGGIWEAGVKSIKYHLKRIIGDTTLTFEELTTVLCRIEACLNSRPLCALSNDPEDYTSLTPGHFLVGRPIIGPQTECTKYSADGKLLTRWQLTQKMTRDFWTSWTKEYLTRLQQRSKWQQQQDNPEVGELVVLKEDNISPLRWPLARIEEIHPGTDGRVRVVTVRSKHHSNVKRPITKICKLPIDKGVSKENVNVSITKSKKGVLFITALMILNSIIPSSCALPYNVHIPNGGLYVEDIGTAQITRGTLRVDAEFSIADIRSDLANITKLRDDFKQFCEDSHKLSDETHCHEMFHHLDEVSHQTMDHIEIILNNWNLRRQTRGLLGDILQKVFGVNDEVYTDIENLNKNQNTLKQAVKDQTKLMISTLIKINDTESKISLKLANFTAKLNKGIDEINQMKRWFSGMDHNKINIQVLVLNQLALSYIKDLDRKYNALLNALLNQGNILNSLRPATITKIITEISQKLPQTLKVLPIPMNKMELQFGEGMLCICGYHHIIENERYQIIAITSIPQKISNITYQMWEVKTPLLAVDYNREQYFPLKLEDMEIYGEPIRSTYLCSPSLIQNFESNHNCLLDEIYNRHGKEACPVQQVTIAGIIFKRLFLENTWLFITSYQVPASVRCNGIRNALILNNTGLLQIDNQCVLEAEGRILKPTIHSQARAISAYNKPMPPTIILSNTTRKMNYLSTEKMLEPMDTFMDHIITNETQLEEDLAGSIWHDVKKHQRSVWYTVLPASIAVNLIIFLWICWRWRASKRIPSTYQVPGEDVQTTV